MSEFEKKEWTSRWSQKAYGRSPQPSSLVATWASRLPMGRAIDLACGDGRNALHLAELGFLVDALDISQPALSLVKKAAFEKGLVIETIVDDLDYYKLPLDTYDLINVGFYMNHKLITEIKDSLKANGFVIYQQHYVIDQQVSGPSSKEFRLLNNEALKRFADFRVHYFSEGVEKHGDTTMALQSLVAQKMPGMYEVSL
jgi:SAM-dependent methyltransferase